MEPVTKRVMSKQRLRQAVLRDLSWLLNATPLETHGELENAPEVRKSVVNFGLRPVSGTLRDSLDSDDIARAVRDAILAFEPRLLPESLEVRVVAEPGDPDHHNAVGLDIRCQLWAQPLALDVLLQTRIDVESGKVSVKEGATPRTA